MPPSNMPNGENIYAFARFKRVILKGVWMICANTNIESVGEKIVRNKTIEIDELGLVESLLNHMNLHDEIDINTPITTRIRERMWKWIESGPFNIIKVKNF